MVYHCKDYCGGTHRFENKWQGRVVEEDGKQKKMRIV
jgi:hypothetical protein